MEIERRTISYLIFYVQGNHKQRTSISGASEDNELVELIRKTFKGRFKRPTALTKKDGVNIVVKRLDHIKNRISLVLNTKIYNKSVRQARIEVETAILKQKSQ